MKITSLSNRVVLGCFVVAIASLSTVANAQTIIKQTSIAYTTHQIDEFATTGAEMAGMEVWVNFATSGWKSAVWTTTGALSGEASVSSFFKIGVNDDTFLANWTLENLTSPTVGDTITEFWLKGQPGKVVFDTTDPSPGTPGSSAGRDFEWVSGIPAANTIVATYWNPVQIDANAPAMDEFERIHVDLSKGQGISGGRNLVFRQDTDKAKPTLDPVPEPASMTALVVGIAAMLRRKKK